MENRTIDEYVKAWNDDDLLHVRVTDDNNVFNRMDIGLRFYRIELNEQEHYLVTVHEGSKNIKGPFATIEELEEVASKHASDAVTASLMSDYREISLAQYRYAKELRLRVITIYGPTRYTGRYVREEDYEDLYDVYEEEEEEEVEVEEEEEDD